MHPHPPQRRALALLVALASLGVLGACGDDDTDDGPGGAVGEDGPGTVAPVVDTVVDDPCALLDAGELAEVLGVDFDGQEPGEDACTYTSTEGVSAISLNVTALDGTPADLALETARSSCDEGTEVEVRLPASDGGFGCTVAGVALVGAARDGVFGVLTGALADDGDAVVQDLAVLLEEALGRV